MFAPIPASTFGYNEELGDDQPEPAMSKRSADDAAAPAAPRVVRILPATQVDADKLVVKSRGKTQHGPIIAAYYDGTVQLHMNITPEKAAWYSIPFGIDRCIFGKYTKDDLAINGGKGKDYEDLPLHMELGLDATRTALLAFDAKAREQMRELTPNDEWTPSVKPMLMRDTDVMRFSPKVIVKSRSPEMLTKFRIRVPAPQGEQSTVHRGSGIEFLKPLLEAHHDFCGAKVKVVVRTGSKVWSQVGKCGLTWQVAELVVDLPERQAAIYENAFGDDVFDE